MTTSLHMEPTAVTELSPKSLAYVKRRKLIGVESKITIATVCAAWLVTMPLFCNAEGWKIDPRVQVSETYSDNVKLEPSGQGKNDFITQINPGISVSRKTGRSDILIDYTIQSRVYASEHDSNSLNHQLAARSNTIVIPDFMFLDASANIAQQNTSLFGPVGISASESSSDRDTAETRSYVISPSIRDRIGASMTYDARYQHDYVGSDSGDLSTSNSDKFFFNLLSGQAFNRFGWGLHYSKEKVDYKSSSDYKTETTSLDGRWSLTPRFALIGTVGHEKNDYVYVGEKPDGNFWSAGISWNPSNMTKLTLSGGHRFFGSTKALDFFHQSRRFIWTARYSEDISSTRENFAMQSHSADEIRTTLALNPIYSSNPEKLENDVRLYQLLTNQFFFTNQVFLEKRFDGSVIYNSGKTSYIFNVFRDQRENQTTGTLIVLSRGSADFASSNNILQRGANFSIDWQWSPKTSVNFLLSKNNVTYINSDREDSLSTVTTGLSHQFSNKTFGSLNIRHVQHTSNISTEDYKENAIIGMFTIHF